MKANTHVMVILVCFLLEVALISGTAAADENVKKAQQQLSELGYEPGVQDGLFGSKTKAALIQYQKDNGLPETGMIDQATANALGVKVYTPKKKEKYVPINPKELMCTVKFGQFSVLSNGKSQEIVGSVKQLKCEGQEIELVDPKIRNQFVRTKKYGKFKITLHPKADAWNIAINISVTDSQKKELLKLKK